MSVRLRRHFSWLLAALLQVPTAGEGQRADTVLPSPRETHYAQVGHLHMYYQLYGKGRPLLLLHGGSSTIEESFPRQLAYFSAHRLLIAPEQQGHGRTRDIDGPLDYVIMAENTAQLLAQLRVTNVDILGWSDGGIVGLLVATKHPELVRRLVVTGASSLPLAESFGPSIAAEVESWKPEADSQGLARYVRRFADSAGHYPIFVAKLKELWLRHPTPAELGAAALAHINAPTLVIDGDHGSVRLEHTIALYRGLPKASLLIVPGTGHNTLGERSDWLNPIIQAFLDRDSVPP
jgi:pimeloyl-ACP methyl ester carboxylesterase